MIEQATTIIVTLITVGGSASAWKFYEKKMKAKADEKNDLKEGDRLYRGELKERVTKLEKDLKEEQSEKKKLTEEVLTLSKNVASLTKEVEYLRKHVQALEDENRILKKGA